MAKTIKSDWVPLFWEMAPCFTPIGILSSELESFPDWPTLEQYQQFFNADTGPIVTASNQPLQIVPQDYQQQGFEQHYAPRIFMTGEVQTRTENWHDFFQVMTWRLFPQTKAVINQRQYHAASTRHQTPNQKGARSATENLLSLFDECGAIIIYSDPSLAELLVSHQWKELFWDRRQCFEQSISCIVFGHALYEKFFNPYIGMTANGILIQQEPDFITLPLQEQIPLLDQQLAARLTDEELYSAPSDLQPLPVLGIPGWYPDNINEAFYHNTDYFRPLSRSRVSLA